MVDFITFFQASQNRNRIFHPGLLHLNLLETSFQCRILFDVFSVFVEGGGPDAVQFSTGQHRFQQIPCIHRSLCLSGSNDIMQFVYEEDDVTFRILDFLEDCF